MTWSPEKIRLTNREQWPQGLIWECLGYEPRDAPHLQIPSARNLRSKLHPPIAKTLSRFEGSEIEDATNIDGPGSLEAQKHGLLRKQTNKFLSQMAPHVLEISFAASTGLGKQSSNKNHVTERYPPAKNEVLSTSLHYTEEDEHGTLKGMDQTGRR